MEKTYITITEICQGYQLERTYVSSLQEFGLIEFHEQESEPQLHTLDLPKFEKIVRFHKDLNINFEGIEVILTLLDKIENMQDKLDRAGRRLHLYNDEI